MKPYLTLTSQQIKNIIHQARGLKSAGEILRLAGEAIEQARSAEDPLDNVPDSLRPLAEALYGLVEATDEEKENPIPLGHGQISR